MPVSGGGDLRSKVTFAERIEFIDEYGNTEGGWLDRFSVRARILPETGGETVTAERLGGRQPVTIRVRSSPDTRLIGTDWKATNVENGVGYNIRAATDPFEGTAEHGRWIDCLAEAGVALG